MRVLILAVALFVVPLSAEAQSSCVEWKCNPYNWDNSSENFNNSSDNWRNSPENFDNSPYNYDAAGRGIYDSEGNRQGYAVREPSGVTNFYSNDGTREGYEPGDEDRE